MILPPEQHVRSNIHQHSKAKKNAIFNNGSYTTNRPHTVTTTGNNKILRTPPPHISSSEGILPRLTLAQLRTTKSPFLKSCLHKVDAKSYPSPLCPLGNSHTHDTHLFNCTHISTTLSPRWSDKTAGQMDGEAGWWTTSGNIGLPPLVRVMGVGDNN